MWLVAHTAALRTILMTYHQYSPTLGYVQGMSDLLSPIYVVYEADEASSFWAFVGWMKVMVRRRDSFAPRNAYGPILLGGEFLARPERDEAQAWDIAETD